MERVALVTGANSGIGWAVAEHLEADGFALAFHSPSELFPASRPRAAGARRGVRERLPTTQ